MELPLDYIKQRTDAWLLGHDGSQLIHLADRLFEEIARLADQPTPLRILLAESDPVRFIAGFLSICSTEHQIFIGNPAWIEPDWRQVLALVKPDLILGNCQYSRPERLESQNAQQNPSGKIMIPTGGSSGRIRFAMHTWGTLVASVYGFQQHFNLARVNSICTLPLYHVSGLMQLIRSLISNGKLLVTPFSALKSGQWLDFDPTEFFLSLVPTQLQALLADAKLTAWLRQCKTVLLGGAPAWPELLECARSHQIRLAPCYGMTETASQIATLKPEAFLYGNSSNGQILPHAKVTILGEVGEPLGTNQTGLITIRAASLALGYYPERFLESEDLQTNDLGFLDAQGDLHVIGRLNDQIITGGENVVPSEVEAAIRATNLVKDVSVIGLSDQYWGQAITAIYVPAHSGIEPQQIQAELENKLARFKQPKHWIPVETLPSNEQGKLNREQLQQIAAQWQRRHTSGSAIE